MDQQRGQHDVSATGTATMDSVATRLSQIPFYPLLALFLITALLQYARLRSFPGPLWAGLSNIRHSAAILGGECHLFYAETNRKYGPIARVAPNILITSSPHVWAHANTHAQYRRSAWYYSAVRVEHRRSHVFSLLDNAEHERRRKQMAVGFSGRENLDLEESIDECLAQFLRLIRTSCLSTDDKVKLVDVARKVQFFTLDVISKIGLGTAFGMLAADRDVDEYIESGEKGLTIANTAMALGLSWLSHAPWIGRFVAPSPRDRNGFGRMMKNAFRLVDERLADPHADRRRDMLGSFIRHGLSGAQLRTEALNLILAGSDTTATGIRGALLHIATNPRVYRKLQEEIDGADVEPDPGLVSWKQAKQLRYLQAVLRESLRLHPPVATMSPRDVPAGGDHVQTDQGSVFLPGGTSIGYSAWAMHRNPGIFGADANVFRPERWLEPEPQREMLLTNDLIFGHGHFRCLGQKVAQMEMSKFIFEVFRHFDVTIADPVHPWQSRCVAGLFQISNMWMEVRERQGEAA